MKVPQRLRFAKMRERQWSKHAAKERKIDYLPFIKGGGKHEDGASPRHLDSSVKLSGGSAKEKCIGDRAGQEDGQRQRRRV